MGALERLSAQYESQTETKRRAADGSGRCTSLLATPSSRLMASLPLGLNSPSEAQAKSLEDSGASDAHPVTRSKEP